jgi:hypothetical protein
MRLITTSNVKAIAIDFKPLLILHEILHNVYSVRLAAQCVGDNVLRSNSVMSIAASQTAVCIALHCVEYAHLQCVASLNL